MDMSGILSSYTNNITEKAASASENKIKNLANADLSTVDDKQLMDACKEFEAYFLEQMFKEMKKTVPTSSKITGASATMLDYFEGDLLKEYAGNAVEKESLGLAQMLFEQMKRNYSI